MSNSIRFFVPVIMSLALVTLGAIAAEAQPTVSTVSTAASPSSLCASEGLTWDGTGCVAE